MDLNVIKELNGVARRIMDLWENELKDDYVLYVDTYDIQGLPPGVVYGRGFILAPESEVQYFDIPPLHTVLQSISNSTVGCVTKIALFNKEELYFYRLNAENDDVVITVGMSSMIYGRSNVYITDVRRVGEQEWELLAGEHGRGRNYSGYVGSIQECLSRILDEEEQLGSPYESMKQEYPYEYSMAMRRELKVAIGKCWGMSVNDFFGI